MAELVREVMINASPATIWALLSEGDRHVEWMGTEAELDPIPGGVYKVLVGGEHPSAGRFIEVVPEKKVVFSFGWDEPGHPIPAGSTEVEITLVPEGDKTRVRLVHRGLPEDAVTDHTHGWDHFLERLAVVAAGGRVDPDRMGAA